MDRSPSAGESQITTSQVEPDPWTIATSGRVAQQVTPGSSGSALPEHKVSFFDKTFLVDYIKGQSLSLSGKSDGSVKINVDDEIEIVVTHEDGSSSVFKHDFSGGCTGLVPNGPFDLSSSFEPGENSVRVLMRDKCGGTIGSWEIWLVTNGVSAGQTIGSCGGRLDAVNPSSCLSDPVNTATGAFVTSVQDLSLAGTGIPFDLTRSYTSFDTTGGPLGTAWTHNLTASLDRSNGKVVYRAGDGQQLEFVENADCSYSGPAGTISTLTGIRGASSYRAQVLQDSPAGYWQLNETSGTNAADESGNGLGGTYQSSPTLGKPRLLPASGQCTAIADTSWSYDFQLACRTHDYAYDLVRFGAPGGDVGEADNFLYNDMQSDCDSRWFLQRMSCRGNANLVWSVLRGLDNLGGVSP